MSRLNGRVDFRLEFKKDFRTESCEKKKITEF